MYYFEENDEYINKFKINVDIAKLTYIYNQLIDKCSFIEEVTEIRDKVEDVSYTDTYYVRDYHYKSLKNGKYSLTYKRYNKCELAMIIESIFRKDINGIYKLFEYNPLSKEEKDKLMIGELSKRIDKVENTNVKEKINMLKQMDFLLQKIESNKNRKDEKDYLDDAKKLVEFEYKGSLNKDIFNSVNLFFEKNLNNNINKKILKKEN